MRKRIALFAVLALALLAFVYHRYNWLIFRYQSAACKAQGRAYDARIEKLKRDAHDGLKIGTRKPDVIRFFQEHGLPVSFDALLGEYEGTILTQGCAPTGCGSDDALLGLRVKVDQGGTVVGEPVVGALYTNCL